MTPAEKAREMYNRYNQVYSGDKKAHEMAKESASIALDLIIENVQGYEIEWWKKVKIELEAIK